MDHDLNPFRDWATVVDCGDISNTPFDKLVAIHELEKGMKAMNGLKPKNDSVVDAARFITIGGDHTISTNPPKSIIRRCLTANSSPNPPSPPFNMGQGSRPTFRFPPRYLGSRTTWWRLDKVFRSQPRDHASHRPRRRSALKQQQHAHRIPLQVIRRALRSGQ